MPAVPRPLDDALVEAPEAQAVVEVAEMCELVAERGHQARVAERLAGDDVREPDPDRAVAIADAVAALHARTLGLDDAVAEAEARGDHRPHRG